MKKSPGPPKSRSHSFYIPDLNIQIDPDLRMGLEIVSSRMQVLKPIVSDIHPIDVGTMGTTYNTVEEKTQCSVVMEKEIEFTTSNTTGKQLQNSIITKNVHDQKYTNLCSTFASVSALRHAQRRFLHKERNRDMKGIIEEQDNLRGGFSFYDCLSRVSKRTDFDTYVCQKYMMGPPESATRIFSVGRNSGLGEILPTVQVLQH